MTAAGVGISTSSKRSAAASMPLAWTMRSMNTLRIASRAGSMLSEPNSAMTFSVTIAGLPDSTRHPATSSDTARFPATTTGQTSGDSASARALATITPLLPPSVPPASSTMSGTQSTMAFTSARVRRCAKLPTSLAPAPSAAWRAASSVSSRTRPTATMRSPPAALLQASRTSNSGSRPRRCSRSARARSIPTVTSVVTVDGP